jgi:hypothetical protein
LLYELEFGFVNVPLAKKLKCKKQQVENLAFQTLLFLIEGGDKIKTGVQVSLKL